MLRRVEFTVLAEALSGKRAGVGLDACLQTVWHTYWHSLCRYHSWRLPGETSFLELTSALPCSSYKKEKSQVTTA